MFKVAIIISHPIQYYAPWFRFLTQGGALHIKVFYLWDFGVTDKVDVGFKQVVRWDVPLLEGYEYEFVPNTSRTPGSHSFWGLRNPALKRRVEAWKPDAVLMIGYNFASMMRFIGTWNTRLAPLLFRGDSHRLVVTDNFKTRVIRREILTQLFKRFTAFMYVGQANRRYLEYHRVAAEQMFFSPHAVDNDFFGRDAERYQPEADEWRMQLKIEPHQPVILFAGKYEAKKRPLDLLHAFTSLSDVERGEAVLVFAGSGELETQLKAEANTNPHVRFVGFQNQAAMPRLYRAADWFVLPSYGGSETWGLAVNEAMNCGCGIIVSTHVGCGEDLVKDGVNGWRFTAGDTLDLRNTLARALGETTRLTAIKAASRQIIAGYSYQAATRGLEAAVEFCISRR